MVLLSFCLFFCQLSSAFAAESVIIKAVGTWGYFTNYQKHEGPFWNERVAQVTDKQIVSEITPQTELDLQGIEIMRLVKQGVFDFAFGLPGYVSPESAIFEGADLSSLTQDIDVQRQVSESYFPTLSQAFKEKYNAQLMTLYPFPSQMIWCKSLVSGIHDLKGKRIRVYLETLSDFVEGVGATPVNAPYKEVPDALLNGSIDCAITGTMSAYTTQLYEIAPYGFKLRVGWGLAFGAMNMDKWNLLDKPLQTTLQNEMNKLTDEMWRETATEDEVALACLSTGPCSLGEIGNMTLVEPLAADLAIRDKVARDVILPRWVKRCGPECTANWNRTVGKVLDLRASIKPE
ncbi:transporter [Leucothrix arctica]|uniref:Transporter n=2 Tax=Leucothrix arctica TaxID=1481894 RepID=A0A317CE92_9GAMM|nr:transporter [Leucothrix arctica]